MTTAKSGSESRNSSPFNRTVQHDAKRTAILSQAAKLFNYKGSRATTLQDIAESLGLSKTSLYYYVRTKEDLIYQCYKVALFKRLREYIRIGVADGSLRSCEPTAATRAILGSVDWTFSWLHSVPIEQVETTAKDALNILAHGISASEEPHVPVDIRVENPEGDHLGGFNREEQNRLKQEAFFKTGTRFFNRQGFNGTSLDEIAEYLNVSKGAFYYHIKNKEDLLFHCYCRSLDILEKIHAQAANTHGTGLEKVELTCLRTFHIQNSAEGPLVRYNTITALPMARRRKILKRTEKFNERFGQFLDEGIRDQSVRPINTFVAQQLLAGAINAAMDIDQWRKVDSIDKVANDYFDVFINGLLPRAKASRH